MADNDLEFGNEFFEFEKKQPEVKQEEKIVETTQEVVLERTNDVPELLGDNITVAFLALVKRVQEQYKTLPSLEYDATYNELSELTVKACPTPTLQIINQELQKSQSAKDRITELDIEITRCLMFKDRAVDILKAAWNKFCDEKSADKRQGDGAYRLSNFELDLSKTQALSKACKYVLMNLVSLQDTLSRRITNIQLQIKLMDIGRSSLPDFDFSKKSMDIQIDEPKNDKPVSPSEPIQAQEMDF